MPTLSLALLGQVSITLDDEPLARTPTKGALALLITLVCRPEVHQRESLMMLFWPAKSPHLAQTNLRQALYHLKQVIPQAGAEVGDRPVPLLLADRRTVQINPDGNYDLDVSTFRQLLECSLPAKEPISGQVVESLKRAAALYRGDFLADFYLPDSAPFEEWVAVQRVILRRQAIAALEALTDNALSSGDFEAAEQCARRQLEIDNLHEAAHRQLMQLLAENGRRAEAMAHFKAYNELLQRELGMEPAAELLALGDRIRAGQEGSLAPEGGTLPAFLLEQSGSRAELPPFVARERELASLDSHLRLALNAQGGAFFVLGAQRRFYKWRRSLFAVPRSDGHAYGGY
jgi:DNA-binding SARP family transcriptional activator